MASISVFVSYSHEDDRWVKERNSDNSENPLAIIPWLARAMQNDGVEFWYDHELKHRPGVEYTEEIQTRIRQASIALLLISQDFVNSEFIREKELPLIKEKVEKKDMLVIPLLVGHVDWDGAPNLKWLTARQMLPGKPTPLIEYASDPARWSKVRTEEILSAIRKRLKENNTTPSVDSSKATSDELIANRQKSGKNAKTVIVAMAICICLITLCVLLVSIHFHEKRFALNDTVQTKSQQIHNNRLLGTWAWNKDIQIFLTDSTGIYKRNGDTCTVFKYNIKADVIHIVANREGCGNEDDYFKYTMNDTCMLWKHIGSGMQSKWNKVQ